jgi:putative intracellular protease/amidase
MVHKKSDHKYVVAYTDLMLRDYSGRCEQPEFNTVHPMQCGINLNISYSEIISLMRIAAWSELPVKWIKFQRIDTSLTSIDADDASAVAECYMPICNCINMRGTRRSRDCLGRHKNKEVAALSTFEHANLTRGEQVYKVSLLSETGGTVRSSAGFSVETEAFGDADFDTVIIGASTQLEKPMPGLIAFIQRSTRTARRIAAACTGAFALAEAGALDGRRATTRWLFARDLRARYPNLRVDEDRIFIVDGPIWTSAGVTGSIDLALAMVEKDLGAETARGTVPF